jgi:hypothetical protein
LTRKIIFRQKVATRLAANSTIMARPLVRDDGGGIMPENLEAVAEFIRTKGIHAANCPLAA